MLLLPYGHLDELYGLADLAVGKWQLLSFLFYFPHHLLFLLGAQFRDHLRSTGLHIIGHGGDRLVLTPVGHHEL